MSSASASAAIKAFFALPKKPKPETKESSLLEDQSAIHNSFGPSAHASLPLNHREELKERYADQLFRVLTLETVSMTTKKERSNAFSANLEALATTFDKAEYDNDKQDEFLSAVRTKVQKLVETEKPKVTNCNKEELFAIINDGFQVIHVK